MIYDYCLVGGGIVGLATALKLLEREPGASIVVLEKEGTLARHQTGHNSGVIHSGIYYKPGSLKAVLCKQGARETKDFCIEHEIPFRTCGKMLVATNALEMSRMEALFQRCRENGIEAERIDAAELRRREPAIRGLGAIFVPASGIVDYKLVCGKMAAVIRKGGGEIVLGVTVTGIEEGPSQVDIDAGERRYAARRLIVCAGGQSDRLARMAGLRIDHQIIPFRGEYYRLPREKSAIITSMIYPIPDPDLPFLGIHLTPMMNGDITVGPNAVLGFAREKYPKFSVDLRDVATFMAFPGFWKVIGQNLRSGIGEMKNSIWRSGYLEECRKYCPELTVGDLLPYEAGIRAQAVARDGSLIHDFLMLSTERMLHVCNAPSPAATSALPIGSAIVNRLLGTNEPVAARA